MLGAHGAADYCPGKSDTGRRDLAAQSRTPATRPPHPCSNTATPLDERCRRCLPASSFINFFLHHHRSMCARSTSAAPPPRIQSGARRGARRKRAAGAQRSSREQALQRRCGCRSSAARISLDWSKLTAEDIARVVQEELQARFIGEEWRAVYLNFITNRVEQAENEGRRRIAKSARRKAAEEGAVGNGSAHSAQSTHMPLPTPTATVRSDAHESNVELLLDTLLNEPRVPWSWTVPTSRKRVG